MEVRDDEVRIGDVEVNGGDARMTPVSPPKRNVTRKPMANVIDVLIGLSIYLGSVAAIGLVALFAGLLLLYVKVVEEMELAARFGDAYLELKRTTPFLIP